MKAYLAEYLFVLGDAKSKLPLLVLMMLFLALLDLVGLGLIAPLIVAVVGKTEGPSHVSPILSDLIVKIDPYALGFLVMAVYVVKAIAAFQIQKFLVEFGETQRATLIGRLMASFLAKPYEYHLTRNTAVMVNSTIYTTWSFSNGILTPSLKLVSDGLMLIVVIAFLAWINWQVVLLVGIVTFVFAGLYVSMARYTLARLGEATNQNSANIVRSVNQGLGALREIRILGIEAYLLTQLDSYTKAFALSAAKYGAVTALPRYVIEGIFIALVVVTAVMVSGNRLDTSALVPVLGIFAVAGIRLLPGATTMISSLNSMRMNRPALQQLAQDLEQLENAQIPLLTKVSAKGDVKAPRLSRELRFDSITYAYPLAGEPAIREVSFVIRAGQTVGFIGRSGSGKSTVADILLGFLPPQHGRVLVDEIDIRQDLRAWMANLAYIPQSIFLIDDTLLSNIAFGIHDSKIDLERVAAAVRAASLEELIDKLPDGLRTVIGERGVRLSGGQRQRVALARALYYDRELIVMDEATASLDNETEKEVVSAIRSLHGTKTLIIIAHRLSTLMGCDTIFQMEDGKLIRSGTYEAMIGAKAIGT